MSDTVLEVTDLVKNYHGVTALEGVSIDVRRGEFLSVVGPSGCGKTTLLKIIGGFEDPTSGRVILDGRDMTGTPAAHRPTSMVFQDLALFPHKTVAENIGFPLKIRKLPRQNILQSVNEMMALMDLNPNYRDRYPRMLSGGERQRVALARSMISSPSVLLLDEPMTALDIKLKKTLQAELKRLHRQLGVTFIHVTHDLEEAMMLADRICVMHSGRILQVGVPDDIYYRPQGKFVAEFIGETNLLDITISEVGDQAVSYSCPAIADAGGRISSRLVEPGLKRGPAVMMVRPELIRLLSGSNEVDCRVDVQIEEVFIRGATIQYRGMDTVGRAPLVLEVPGTSEFRLKIGDCVSVGWDKKDIFVFQSQNDSDG